MVYSRGPARVLEEGAMMELYEFIHAPAVTCSPDTTLAETARLMEQHNVGSVIVVGSDGAVMGMITDRDLAMRGMARQREPQTPVAEIMTANVSSIREDADVFDAAREMATSGCRRLPVVGVDGTLKGIVALDDLMVLFTRQADNLAHVVAAEIAGW
jgi:signal-transduction protein with cAMP-binding, CBS, and nucleotidyltransferase domain